MNNATIETALHSSGRNNALPGFSGLCVKMAVVHTISYMFMGIIAMTLMDYKSAFAQPELACWMRSFDDPLLQAGVLFQPLRGILFALAFYPVRSIVFEKHGWYIMGWLLVALGILGTFGPAPGSFEGYLFTRLHGQYMGYIEVVPQALLLAAIVCYWVRNPKNWLNWLLGVLFVITMLLPILGMLSKHHPA